MGTEIQRTTGYSPRCFKSACILFLRRLEPQVAAAGHRLLEPVESSLRRLAPQRLFAPSGVKIAVIAEAARNLRLRTSRSGSCKTLSHVAKGADVHQNAHVYVVKLASLASVFRDEAFIFFGTLPFCRGKSSSHTMTPNASRQKSPMPIRCIGNLLIRRKNTGNSWAD